MAGSRGASWPPPRCGGSQFGGSETGSAAWRLTPRFSSLALPSQRYRFSASTALASFARAGTTAGQDTGAQAAVVSRAHHPRPSFRPGLCPRSGAWSLACTPGRPTAWAHQVGSGQTGFPVSVSDGARLRGACPSGPVSTRVTCWFWNNPTQQCLPGPQVSQWRREVPHVLQELERQGAPPSCRPCPRHVGGGVWPGRAACTTEPSPEGNATATTGPYGHRPQTQTLSTGKAPP